MEDKNQDFDERQFLGQEGIEQDSEEGDGNHQQRSMPALKDIILMVKHDETLNNSSRKEGN